MSKVRNGLDDDERLRRFDAATRRQTERQARRKLRPTKTRGWGRAESYGQDARELTRTRS